jgi:hypothetical protein
MTQRHRILILIVVVMVAALLLACSMVSYSQDPGVVATAEFLATRAAEKPTVVYLMTAQP